MNTNKIKSLCSTVEILKESKFIAHDTWIEFNRTLMLDEIFDANVLTEKLNDVIYPILNEYIKKYEKEIENEIK